MKEYRVVRSYHNGQATEDINEYLENGWQFERASERVPDTEVNGKLYYGYIEYVISRETDVTPAERLLDKLREFLADYGDTDLIKAKYIKQIIGGDKE